MLGFFYIYPGLFSKTSMVTTIAGVQLRTAGFRRSAAPPTFFCGVSVT